MSVVYTPLAIQACHIPTRLLIVDLYTYISLHSWVSFVSIVPLLVLEHFVCNSTIHWGSFWIEEHVVRSNQLLTVCTTSRNQILPGRLENLAVQSAMGFFNVFFFDFFSYDLLLNLLENPHSHVWSSRTISVHLISKNERTFTIFFKHLSHTSFFLVKFF